MAALLSGLDVLVEEDFARLRGKRVGVLVHQPSVDRRFRHLLDLLRARTDLTLVRVFAPEHGLFGAAQDQIPLDRTGGHEAAEVVNLYGPRFESLWPRTEDLRDLDVLVADIQDVGSRYYTYVTTLTFCLERAAEAGCPVLVLDRPNPLGGRVFEGGLIDIPRWRSFVGYWPLLVRHGWTTGELVRAVNEEQRLGAELSVVPMRGWSRERLIDESDYPWVLPSPNMPTLRTAWVYPGGCLIEGTNLSEGRGTTRPFELVGAPFLPARELIRRLEAEGHPGVVLRPTRFQPTFHKFAGEPCEGLQVHVTDPYAVRSWRLFVRLLTHLHELDVGLEWRREPYEYVSDRLAIDLLLGDARVREMIEGHAPLADLDAFEAEAVSAQTERHRAYSLYD